MEGTSEEHIKAYRDRGLNIPTGSYVVVNTRSFGPGKILVVDLNEDEILVYSPYDGHSVLLQRRLFSHRWSPRQSQGNVDLIRHRHDSLY